MFNDKITAIKEHIQENRQKYILFGVTIAGFTYIIMRRRHAEIRGVSDGPDMVTVRPFFFLSNKNNVVTVIEREGRGHPGYIIRCMETGKTYLSQGEAAKALEISPTVLSGHLNKKFSDVDGYHFERIGKV